MKLIVHFDGACEPKNPGGVASGGWIIAQNDGEILHEGCEVFCHGTEATNNVAEYKALEKALRWLDESNLKPETIQIYGDSKLAVNQISGAWRSNTAHLITLRDSCRSLIAKIADKGPIVTINWVPREQNVIADMLSRKAYEDHTGKKLPRR